MITKILVVLTTDETPIPRSFYGGQELFWPDGIDDNAIEKRLLIEAEGCAMAALDEYRRE